MLMLSVSITKQQYFFKTHEFSNMNFPINEYLMIIASAVKILSRTRESKGETQEHRNNFPLILTSVFNMLKCLFLLYKMFIT